MIELLKLDGTLKARAKLLADYTEAKVAEAKQQWLDDMLIQYETDYPIATTDDDGVVTPIEVTVTFDDYLNETKVVQEETEDTEEVIELVRQFTPPVVTDEDLTEYLKTRYAECRQAEYPPMAMYLDAVVKGDEKQKAEYIKLCEAVKAKYPK